MYQGPDNIKPQLWQTLAQAVAGHAADLGDFGATEIMAAARRHGIIPLLHHQVSQGRLENLPDSLGGQLAGQSRSLAAQDLLLNDSTRRLLELLAQAGIRNLLLKGTPVAWLCYPQPWLRPRCDTDLYIAEDDAERVKVLLREHGYQVGGEAKRRLASAQCTASVSRFQQVVTTFDIHWKLSNRILFQETLPFAECYAGKQHVPSLGENALALSKMDLLLHACVHRIAHGRNTERDRLLWLYDIHLLWAAMDDAERDTFAAKALQKKIGALCADALEMTASLFNTELAEEFRERLRTNARKEPTARLLYASKLRWAWADLAALKGLRAKFAFGRELLRL